MALRADLVRDGKLQATIMTKWTTASRKVRTNMITADKARAFFFERLAMRIWGLRLAERKQAALVDKRRIADIRNVFAGM